MIGDIMNTYPDDVLSVTIYPENSRLSVTGKQITTVSLSYPDAPFKIITASAATFDLAYGYASFKKNQFLRNDAALAREYGIERTLENAARDVATS